MKSTFSLTDDERGRLALALRACGERRSKKKRIQALLLTADGLSNGQIAGRLSIGASTVTQWRREYRLSGAEAYLGTEAAPPH